MIFGKLRGCQKGYTLTELAVVCAVVGVLAAIAVPNMIWWRRSQELQSAASALASAMYTSRTKSISERVNYTLTADYTSNSYTITKAGGAAKPGTKLGSVDLYLDESDEFCPPLSDQNIVFRPNSTTDSPGFEAVYVRSPYTSVTRRYRVKVLGPTGKVTVEKWTGGTWQNAY